MSLPDLRLATREDEAELRSLMRNNSMPGSISLSYEREPDYFVGAGVDGSLSQTIIARDEAGLLGMGTRAVRQMYVNGEIQETGYMSHLRVDGKRIQGVGMVRQLVRAFGKFHELHGDRRTPFYLMGVIADNFPAMRLLTGGLPGMPSARPYARMFTYAVSPRHVRPEVKMPPGVGLENGTKEHIPEILACLQRNSMRMQFAPFWSETSLFSPEQTPNLNPRDFLLAVNGSHVSGCLALWDQTPFKQTIVRGYNGSTARWRGLTNLLARVMDIPYLPGVNCPLRYCYASHLAVDNDDPLIFAALLRAAYNETARRGFNYFMLGLSETNRLRTILTRNYLHITYPSQIYGMAWEDGATAWARVDGRVPGLEIALL
jgi:hypothetical protein